jgi:hypothetical protein
MTGYEIVFPSEKTRIFVDALIRSRLCLPRAVKCVRRIQ